MPEPTRQYVRLERRPASEQSIEQMLASAERRASWKTADSLSGSRFERLTIDGVAFVVKYICVDDDWIMRATGDLHCRQLELLRSPVLDRLPPSIDNTIAAFAPYTSAAGHRGAALLMHDVENLMIPTGRAPISLEVQRCLLEDMAAMHATYWNFTDTVGLFPLSHHYVFLTPCMAELERGNPRGDPVPAAVDAGWRALATHNPKQARLLQALADDPSPLVAVLDAGPRTLLHGDWKFGNLGRHGDGRTVLLDWDRCGAGPPLVDLAWYLAVNCDRLPESKEATIDRYRASLEGQGIVTAPWWEDQLVAALIGAALQLAWSKTEDQVELSWWSTWLSRGLPRL